MHISRLLNPEIHSIQTNLDRTRQDLLSGSTACSPLSPQPQRYFCKFLGCHKSFSRKFNLNAHLCCHLPQKPFVCVECPLKFSRRHDLTRHVKSKHFLKSYGPCRDCDAMFSRSDAYQRHLRLEEERRVKSLVGKA
jgi:uncharacterized Zn-finger protein